MSTDIKLQNKVQTSKIFQQVDLLVLGQVIQKNAPTNIPVLIARDNLPGLVNNLASNAINKFERKISGKGAVSAGKRFTLFILNEDMNDIIIVKKMIRRFGCIN